MVPTAVGALSEPAALPAGLGGGSRECLRPSRDQAALGVPPLHLSAELALRLAPVSFWDPETPRLPTSALPEKSGRLARALNSDLGRRACLILHVGGLGQVTLLP